MVFAYPDYYPSGGWNDFEGSFDILTEAREKASELTKTNWLNAEIIDLHTGKEVKKNIQEAVHG